MATKLIEKGKSVYEVTVGLKGKKWTDAQEKAYLKLAKKVQVKGFRKGQAPINLAKSKINPGDMLDEAINSVIPELFSEVISEHKLKPLYRPNVNVTKVSDTEVEMNFRIICLPEVKLGKYKGIDIPADKVNVSAEEVKEETNRVLEENAELVVKEYEGAALGDTVVLDFKGYVDNKEFEGGAAENYSLVLGSNSFIPGFETQLVGAKAGDKVDVNVTFPEQYMKELAGKAAKFACKIHEVKTKKLPELNEEFFKSLNTSTVKDKATFDEYIKAKLILKKTQDAKSAQFNKVLQSIIDGSTVEMADEVLANETASVKEEMVNQMTQNGLTFEQYKEITGMDDEQLNKQFEEQAKDRLNQFLVLNKIAEVENLIVSKDEVNAYYENMAKAYNMKVEDVRKALESQESRLLQTLLTRKIEKFIEDNNNMGTKPVATKNTAKKEETASKTTTKKTTTKKTTAAK